MSTGPSYTSSCLSSGFYLRAASDSSNTEQRVSSTQFLVRPLTTIRRTSSEESVLSNHWIASSPSCILTSTSSTLNSNFSLSTMSGYAISSSDPFFANMRIPSSIFVPLVVGVDTDYKRTALQWIYEDTTFTGYKEFIYPTAKYVGYWENDKWNGIGTILFNDGTRIEGTWEYGVLKGKGIFIKPGMLNQPVYWENVRHIIAPIQNPPST